MLISHFKNPAPHIPGSYMVRLQTSTLPSSLPLNMNSTGYMLHAFNSVANSLPKCLTLSFKTSFSSFVKWLYCNGSRQLCGWPKCSRGSGLQDTMYGTQLLLDLDNFNKIWKKNGFCNPVSNNAANWLYLILQNAHHALYLKKKITTKKIAHC